MWHAVHEEWMAFLSLLRFQWPLVLLFVVGISALLYVVRPLPPASLRIATGQPNSSLDLLGKSYAQNFIKHGVQLEIVNTAGAFENVELLKQGKVDAAFSLGGMVSEEEAPGLVSLGSVEYQPFWMFYRGTPYDGSNPAQFFKGKTFSINIPGSGTRNLTAKILALHGIQVIDNQPLVSMSSSRSVEALRAGNIDGIFLVAGIESQTIQSLIHDPNIHVFSFVSAQAYSKNLNFLETLTLPRGGFSLVADVPRQDTQLVATTTTILTTEKLHPALQHLFLTTAKHIDHGGSSFFGRAGGFPAYVARDLPASSVADRYYTNGAPALLGHVPFWLSSFVDQVWFILLACFAIGYPLLKIFPNYRAIYARMCMTDCYYKLKEFDSDLLEAHTREDLQIKLDEFDALEKKVNHLWIPIGVRDEFYGLKNAIEIVRLKTERMKEHVEASLTPVT